MNHNDQTMSDQIPTTLEIVTCPVCGNEAHYETVHDTGEENLQCHHCGYARRMTITNLREVQTQENWQPLIDLQEIKGHGCYKFLTKKDIMFNCGSFTNPQGVLDFVQFITMLGEEVDHAEYSTYNGTQVEYHMLVEGQPQRRWNYNLTQNENE